MKTKIKTLEKAKETLKKEFIGLDDIIDQIITAVTPWYVTPEVIQRPVVVSLWGMTGTGKTSIVSRLIELLDLKRKSMFFDCGKENNEGASSVGDKINEFFRLEDAETGMEDLLKDLVFVFDEFQYSRTIDESGCEENNKSNLRPIWNLMDTGILNINENNYDFSVFLNFAEDFLEYAKTHKTVPIENGKIKGKEDVKELLEHLGYFYYDRGVPGYSDRVRNWDEDTEAEDKKDPYREIDVIEPRVLRVLLNRLKIFTKKSSLDYIKEINSYKTVGELAEYIVNARNIFTTPRYINCTKALIFVLGNLDEAFGASSDLSPDIDADIFYDETSKVSIGDIKNSLLRRFRPEQVARIGNNIIKYPSLKRCHFEKIIEMEIEKACTKFKEATGITVTTTKDLRDLIYSEGVYPVQGVRPLFTTIGTIFTPVFSDIVQKKMKGTVEVGVKDPELGWSRDSVVLYYGKEEKQIDLVLGKLRAPKNRKLRFCSGVHEAGHAIVMSYLTGEIPSAIIGVDSDRGGVTITYNSEMMDEIDSKKDLDNDIMISLAGYYAETAMFSGDRVLLGSGSDIDSAWKKFSDGVYGCGYLEPVAISNWMSENNGSGVPSGFSDKGYITSAFIRFQRLEDKTIEIIKENMDLLRKVGLVLGEKGKIMGPEFEEMIKENTSGTLNEERLKEAKEENSWEYYEKTLRDEKRVVMEGLKVK